MTDLLCSCYRLQLRTGSPQRTNAPMGSGHINPKGYRVHTINGEREYEHRLVMKAKIREIVHHKDGDPLNNDPGNLEILFSRSEHMKLHWDERKKHD